MCVCGVGEGKGRGRSFYLQQLLLINSKSFISPCVCVCVRICCLFAFVLLRHTHVCQTCELRKRRRRRRDAAQPTKRIRKLGKKKISKQKRKYTYRHTQPQAVTHIQAHTCRHSHRRCAQTESRQRRLRSSTWLWNKCWESANDSRFANCACERERVTVRKRANEKESAFADYFGNIFGAGLICCCCCFVRAILRIFVVVVAVVVLWCVLFVVGAWLTHFFSPTSTSTATATPRVRWLLCVRSVASCRAYAAASLLCCVCVVVVAHTLFVRVVDLSSEAGSSNNNNNWKNRRGFNELFCVCFAFCAACCCCCFLLLLL